jgi:hypothetical protein
LIAAQDQKALEAELKQAQEKEHKLQDECECVALLPLPLPFAEPATHSLLVDQLLICSRPDLTIPPFDYDVDLPSSDDEAPRPAAPTAAAGQKRPREMATGEASSPTGTRGDEKRPRLE